MENFIHRHVDQCYGLQPVCFEKRSRLEPILPLKMLAMIFCSPILLVQGAEMSVIPVYNSTHS
jgi:hypothetical protein